MSSRRQFLKTLSAVALSQAIMSPLFGKTEKSRIPIAFSTLGCPAWDWSRILEFAHQHGFSAIELRGLQGNLDLPSHAIFATDRVEQTKKEIRGHKLSIACVSSSANLYMEEPDKRAKELADARRFIDLASTLGAPYVRVLRCPTMRQRHESLPDYANSANMQVPSL
jgi:sugar phosphate isomerase/epimerase